ncbi:hypothetical protein ARMSODRAFT_1090527 [Armillaria solidipes]|uniref:F-box domain-containing protein n=1 Tax=Armillaria solidipes TaxID=1076256 RepID=A0A2H3AQW7_9AGAR|nr:hypothetical protein ARMSODRAFT_1090527 [Armillaria solidipes]
MICSCDTGIKAYGVDCISLHGFYFSHLTMMPHDSHKACYFPASLLRPQIPFTPTSPPRLSSQYMSDLIADDPVTAVLYNADLLGFICKDLWDIEQAPGGLVNGIRIHSLYSLALTCHAVSETALDCLWQEIRGMKPLLYIFPRTLSPDNGQWILPDIISDDTWARFEQYSCRIRSITLDAQLRTIHSSSIFLRLAERQVPLFPNLQKLNVDMNFAADTSILFFLASPLLDDVTIAFPAHAMIDTASASVRTVGWKLPTLRSFTISCVPDGNNPRPLGTICPFTNFSGLRNLRRLKIESHPADVDFLVQLSSFPDLAHLQIVISQSLPTESRQTRDGFRSLVSLHITAHVSSMPRILRLIRPGSLTSLTYIDAYSQSYNEIGEFMQDFHAEIVSRFPSLLTLSLNYRTYYGQLAQQYWESTRAVFEPLYGLGILQAFTYNGMLSLENDTVELLLAPAWPEIRTIDIPVLQGPCPTYKVLCTLAKCCPHLSKLSMPITFPDDDAPLRDHHGPLSHHDHFPEPSSSRMPDTLSRCSTTFSRSTDIRGLIPLSRESLPRKKRRNKRKN